LPEPQAGSSTTYWASARCCASTSASVRQASIRSRHGSTIVGEDDLEDVGLGGVVRPERPLALASERALQQRSEDRRLDAAPVEVAGSTQERQLVGLEVDRAGP
jgi:hypothetical protein